jgi:hypothetical protein
MNSDKNIKVERERPFSAHHMLLGAARDALEYAKSDPSQSSFAAVTAITMSALAIEALCNTIGERVVPGWEDFESSSPKAKLRIICDELEIKYDNEIEPWSTVIWLSGVRNKLAHAKPQLVNESHLWNEQEHKKKDGLKPESKLEKTMTIGNANRAYEKITELKYLLCKHIPPEKAFGLAADMWSGSSSA